VPFTDVTLPGEQVSEWFHVNVMSPTAL